MYLFSFLNFNWQTVVSRYDDFTSYVEPNGPLATCMHVVSSLYSYSSGCCIVFQRLTRLGVYSDPTCQNQVTDHCVLGVGATTVDGTSVYTMRNSW